MFQKGALAHEEVLKIFSSSLVYIGLSKSDGISASMIEAMAQGAVPIQSRTSCGEEWLEDGIGGYLVDFDDPQGIAEILAHLISDSGLVRRAQISNRSTLEQKLDKGQIRARVLQTYGLESRI